MAMNRVVRLYCILMALFCWVLSANADPTLSLSEPTIQKQPGAYRLRILDDGFARSFPRRPL